MPPTWILRDFVSLAGIRPSICALGTIFEHTDFDVFADVERAVFKSIRSCGAQFGTLNYY